ncbi:MAG: type II toxin-antitoxin system Phd/YefM family antitoxin [Rhodospirillales bacterium]|nr:type II toxin-antitoxin system Phd/YefM family antitoxin [Rhodospirillales bacterium]
MEIGAKFVETIGAYEAKTHLPSLLDRVARGESLTITRHGKPVARLVPVAGDRALAKQAAARIEERRRHLNCIPLADLVTSVHEGHRY